MTLCQRTNAGREAPVARWLQRHGAELRVDDRLMPDAPVKYRLVEVGAPLDTSPATYRTVEHFGMAIETPGGVPWRS